MGLWEAVAIAVGTMIGASIFSIFGVGAEIAGKNLPEAFVLSGLLSFMVAYSYAKMGSKIVSNAGPIAFILEGFGDNVITGTLSILMWLSYVVSISLFVKGFAGYFLPLCSITVTPISMGIVEAVVISFFTSLNFFGSKAVGRAEFYIVLTKLSILGVFIVLGVATIKPDLIMPASDPQHILATINAAVVFFLSYMGFGLITNASENMKNPEKNVPRAIYISISLVAVVYILVSAVAVGNLPLAKLIQAKDNALAVAAKPFLGNFGFMLISIGALFSISSALNATIYGGANIAYALAKDGELPKAFARKAWFKSTEGLYLTVVLGLFFALLFNINGIAMITSAVFIMIYIFVIVSHYRVTDKVGGSKALLLLNGTTISAVLVLLLYYQWHTQRSVFYGTVLT
ncbi:MAG TPA: amino acid permease, partial [Candidatus Acetothermia bacterium]|nr:amino acid permease [Candidatus Acetothermia bacterium]